MTEWEQLDIRGKLAMCLTADLSDSLQVKTLDVMLMKGRGYQKEDVDKYRDWMQGLEDFEYREALGTLRDTYLPKEPISNYYADPILLDGIATLSYPQQIECATYLIERLEWADSVMRKMYAGEELPPDAAKVMKESEQMLCALRTLLIKLGVEDGTEI